MGMINAAAFSQQAVGNMGMNLGMLQTPSQTIRMQAQQQVNMISFHLMLYNYIHTKS